METVLVVSNGVREVGHATSHCGRSTRDGDRGRGGPCSHGRPARRFAAFSSSLHLTHSLDAIFS